MDKKKKIITFAVLLFSVVAIVLMTNGKNMGGMLSSSVLSDEPTSLASMTDTQIQNEISSLIGGKSALQESIEQLQKDVSQVQKDIQLAQNKVSDINKTCNKKERGKEVAQKALQDLLDSWKPIKSSLDSATTQKESFLSKIKDLETQKNNNNSLVTDLQNQQKNYKSNTAEYKKLTSQIAEQKKKSTTANAQIDKDIAQLKKDITESDKQIQALNTQLNDTYQYLEDAYAKLSTDKKSAETKLSENETIISQNNTTLSGLIAQQKNYKSNTTEYKNITTQITTIKNQNTTLTTTNRTLSAEIKKLQADIATADKPTSKLSKARAVIKSQEDKVNSIIIPTICSELNDTATELSSLETKKVEIEKALTKAQETEKKNSERLAVLQAELNARQAEYSAKMIAENKANQEKQAQIIAEAQKREAELNAQGICSNGSTNPPACDNNYCANGAGNPPACDDNQCKNGATNFPECDNGNQTVITGTTGTNGGETGTTGTTGTNGGETGTTNTTSCTNGASNYPGCDDNQCTNGYTNYPDCCDPYYDRNCKNNGEPVKGCTDPVALNYNPSAEESDDSCRYAPCDDEYKALNDAKIEEDRAENAYEDAKQAFNECYNSILGKVVGCNNESKAEKEAFDRYSDAIDKQNEAEKNYDACLATTGNR